MKGQIPVNKKTKELRFVIKLERNLTDRQSLKLDWNFSRRWHWYLYWHSQWHWLSHWHWHWHWHWHTDTDTYTDSDTGNSNDTDTDNDTGIDTDLYIIVSLRICKYKFKKILTLLVRRCTKHCLQQIRKILLRHTTKLCCPDPLAVGQTIQSLLSVSRVPSELNFESQVKNLMLSSQNFSLPWSMISTVRKPHMKFVSNCHYLIVFFFI